MTLLAYLGQDPQRSMQRFLIGLGLFALGLIFVYLGYIGTHYWQIIGLFLIGVGCLFAIWGYLGMFANRLYHILNRANSKRDN